MKQNLPPLISTSPAIQDIQVRTQSRCLALQYADGQKFDISMELLRVYSPSAEVRGHGPVGGEQEILQTGMRLVHIVGVEPVGHYAIKILFSDEHASGIYTWAYLYWLGLHQQPCWQAYCEELQAAGLDVEVGRDLPMPKKVKQQSCST